VDLLNCPRCGALFVKQRSPLCAECTKWFAETYTRIREYLRAHPKSTLWDVHVALELPLSVVQQVIKFTEENEKK